MSRGTLCTVDQGRWLDAAQRSALYLLRQIGADGRFVYRRDASDPEWLGNGYNLLRHAGALLALAEAQPLFPPSACHGPLKRALACLLGWLAPIPEHPQAWAAWSRPQVNDTVAELQVKLGGTALTLLALLKLRALLPGKISSTLLEQLGESLLWMQRPDGSFRSKWIPSAGNHQPAWTSLFYPGQAVLALIHLSQEHDCRAPERWQAAAHRGLLHLASSRQELPIKDVPLDHWALIAQGAWPHPPEPLLLGHTRQVVEAMLQRQQRALQLPNRLGAFSSNGSSTTTATCVEGLQAAAPLLQADLPLHTALQQACERGADNLLRAQLRCGVWDGAMPALHSQRPMEVRIDYVQHGLAAFLGQAQATIPTPLLPPRREAFRHVRLWLAESLDLGLSFLLGCQQGDGSMRYLLPMDGSPVPMERHAVREAGGVWGLALFLHRQALQAEQRQALWAALDRCLDHLEANSGERWGRRWPVPPQASSGMLGTAALQGLALVEMLAQADCPQRPRREQLLQELLAFVLSCRCERGRFHARYQLATGAPERDPSPYYDGEALLLLARSTRLLGLTECWVPASQAGDAMDAAYAAEAIATRQPSALCKGFYQWGSLAFHELHTLAPHEPRWQQRTLALADWILNVHRVLERRRNTGYAFEGLITAWRLAREQGDAPRSEALRRAVEQGLARLASWQVGSSLQQRALQEQRPLASAALGGVLSAPGDPLLRIDTTQHQMHALLLAERHLLGDQP